MNFFLTGGGILVLWGLTSPLNSQPCVSRSKNRESRGLSFFLGRFLNFIRLPNLVLHSLILKQEDWRLVKVSWTRLLWLDIKASWSFFQGLKVYFSSRFLSYSWSWAGVWSNLGPKSTFFFCSDSQESSREACSSFP